MNPTAPAAHGSSITRDLSTTDDSQHNGNAPAAPQKLQNIVRRHAPVANEINAARVSEIVRSPEIAESEGGETSLQGDLFSRIQACLAQGMTQKEAAQRLGVSESTVSRTLADHRDIGGSGPAQSAVDAFVESLGASLAPDVAARIEALRALAAKLDWARRATTGTAAMAASSLAKEFRSLLDELRQSTSFDELREALLAGDAD